MLGDWGTHMKDNVAMLRQGLRILQPDVIIHLGDIYYSGTSYECGQNVLQVMDELAREPGIKRPPFFTIPGNHEYYSGGGGYFDMIDRINSGFAGCQQRASYFCLRSADGAWQFLGMDTGYNDRDPVENVAPGLRNCEIEWHRDKLDTFKGTTILLSHHQLVSANAQLTDGATPYLNTNLSRTFTPYFDRVAAWFWGHEHNFVMFKDGQCGLRKGRLVGCSAYEETRAEDPYKNNFPKMVAYAPNMKQVDLSPYQGDIETYYNHAMALLEVSPAKIDVSYYQFPSWGLDFTPPKVDAPTFLLKETITPTPPPIA
jgi:DNA repair exonuclease SbcCD nuclease subunit